MNAAERYRAEARLLTKERDEALDVVRGLMACHDYLMEQMSGKAVACTAMLEAERLFGQTRSGG